MAAPAISNNCVEFTVCVSRLVLSPFCQNALLKRGNAKNAMEPENPFGESVQAAMLKVFMAVVDSCRRLVALVVSFPYHFCLYG